MIERRLNGMESNLKTTFKTLAILTLSLMLTACGATQTATPTELPPDMELQIPRKVTIRLGETGGSDGKAVIIHFLEVLEDSRCPTGAECVTAGRVGILVDVTYNGEIKTVELWLEGSDESQKTYVEFPGLAVYLTAVEPYPRVDVVQERETYSADFEIRFAGP